MAVHKLPQSVLKDEKKIKNENKLTVSPFHMLVVVGPIGEVMIAFLARIWPYSGVLVSMCLAKKKIRKRRRHHPQISHDR